MTIEEKRRTLQLNRLERIMDVVFALVIWRLFTLLPKEKNDGTSWNSVGEMLVDEWLSFIIVLLILLTKSSLKYEPY